MNVKSAEPLSRELAAQHMSEWSACQRCDLHQTAVRHVLLRGWVPCRILFIGEAPGETENATGIPFVGRSGKLLDKLIAASSPPKKVFPRYAVTNIIACAPWADATRQKVRKPDATEAEMCSPRITELLEIAKPRGIVLLGKTAEKFFSQDGNYKIISLPHPAYMLRRGGTGSLEFKRSRLKLQRFVGRII